jgi:hypothetical protein
VLNPFLLVEVRTISTCVVEVHLIQITDVPDLLHEPVLADQWLVDWVIFMLPRKSRFNTEQVWVRQPMR